MHVDPCLVYNLQKIGDAKLLTRISRMIFVNLFPTKSGNIFGMFSLSAGYMDDNEYSAD